MTTHVIQVNLNVPEGSGLELLGDEYAELVEEALNVQLERGKLPGVAGVEAEFQECV